MDAICGCCGEAITNFPPDLAFQRPDDIWALSPADKEARATDSDDLCDLDNQRFFVRGVLFIPLTDRDELWGLGIWAEVPEEDFLTYLANFEDSEGLESFEGTVANHLAIFPGALGTRVRLHFGDNTKRPSLSAAAESSLGQAQLMGMTDAELHKAIRQLQAQLRA